MKVKLKVTEDIYKQMCEWWDGHDFPRVDPSLLPHKTFVCYNEDTPIYSVCFYNTDSNLCWIGWQISNPNVDNNLKKGGLNFLIEAVEAYSKKVGYDVVFTTSATPKVVGVLKERGYTTGDKNVDHYIKTI